MQLTTFDNNQRRKRILIKYTALVFLAYTITQVATVGAWWFGISSVKPPEIFFVSAITLGSALGFGLLVHLKKAITTRFANFVFFGQFAVWLVMYPIWFLSLREIRGMALFCALMALSFLLSHAKLLQSIIITATATIIQIVGSYYAIVYLKQPGSFAQEVFYTLCFLPSALFICHLSDQYARQRSEVALAKHAAEESRDALRLETEKAHRLNAELQGAMATIQEISIRDVLTGLYNRRHLLDRLAMDKKRADRKAQSFSIVILDIDHFKRINDAFGHMQGDVVLKVVAQVIQDSLRDTDFCARFGGEEFVMLLEQTGEESAMVCAERTRRLVAATKFPQFDDDFQVTVSLGVSVYQAVEEISQTLTRADEALYRAKHGGRNRVEGSLASAPGMPQERV